MLNLRPASKFPASTFRDYDTASKAVRAALGVSRLSPKLADAVRSAVARHADRDGRKSAPIAPDIMARLRRQLASEVSEAITPITSRLYRYKGAEDDRIEIGPEPRAHTSAPTEWVSGRGGFGNVVTSTTFNIAVMPSWRRRVLTPGMARLDGMLTTHAYPVLAEGEITIYRAAWVRQRAGYNIATERGFLAFHAPSGTAYHLATAWPSDGPNDYQRVGTDFTATDWTPPHPPHFSEGTGEVFGPGRAESYSLAAAGMALKGLRRKLKLQSIPSDVRDAKRAESDRKRQERRSAAITKLAGQLSRLDISEVGHVVVSRSDSLRAGNCVPGTDDFFERFIPGRGSATIAEFAEAIGRQDITKLAGDDLTLARQCGAACLVAIRRDRNARRLVGV